MKLSILLGLIAIFFVSAKGVYYKPTPPPSTDKCFCQEIEPWEFGEVECDDSQPYNGLWILGDQCRYTCRDGQVLRQGDSDVRECRPAQEDPVVDSTLAYVWKPEAPVCIDDPTRCLDEPFWRENTPGPQGTIDCGPALGQVGYPLGHQCSYICPSDHFPVGVTVTTCESVNVNGEIVNRFTPANPCCEQTCDPNREADVLYVVDWSSSIREDEWTLMRNFLADMTTELSGNPNLRYGLVAFGNGVRTELNIPFTSYSQGLLNQIQGLPFNGNLEGTHTVAALQFVADTVFGSANFGERPGVDNLVVFITDGVSTDGNGAVSVEQAANAMHAVTDTVYSVGVGLNRIVFENNRMRAEDELEFIAQVSQNVFNIDEFNNLNENIERITQIACDLFCDTFTQAEL